MARRINFTRLDLAGKRFGRLLVIAFAFVRGKSYWTCQCLCGQIKTIRGDKLITGRTVSCGCSRADREIRADAAAQIDPDIRHKRAAKGGRIARRNRIERRRHHIRS